MEITKLLTISTIHISPATAKAMEAAKANPDAFPITVWESQYGFITYAGWAEDPHNAALPADLVACMEHAHKAGCGFVRLDGDGPQVEGLPVYDWESAA